jgi:glutamyl-Q tRNA(Asp) synthetase
MHKKNYIGRFAPSPSGDLHFGSLTTALGSFLRARSQQGTWLLRIEDIDPPREVKGSAASILHHLELLGLHWDQEVSYQSKHSDRYEACIEQLRLEAKVYACDCTRKQIKALGSFYEGSCAHKHLPMRQPNTAVRFSNHDAKTSFEDRLLGEVQIDPCFANEDFTLIRRDGLYAYQLAVVADDVAQGITEVVRGADLAMPTIHQINLMNALHAAPPDWLHLPLMVSADGKKLSKQNRAKPIDKRFAIPLLTQALKALGQPIPENPLDYTPETLLQQAVQDFNLSFIPKKQQIVPED